MSRQANLTDMFSRIKRNKAENEPGSKPSEDEDAEYDRAIELMYNEAVRPTSEDEDEPQERHNHGEKKELGRSDKKGEKEDQPRRGQRGTRKLIQKESNSEQSMNSVWRSVLSSTKDSRQKRRRSSKKVKFSGQQSLHKYMDLPSFKFVPVGVRPKETYQQRTLDQFWKKKQENQ